MEWDFEMLEEGDNQVHTQGVFCSGNLSSGSDCSTGSGRSKREIARRRIERLPRCGSTGSFSLWEVANPPLWS